MENKNTVTEKQTSSTPNKDEHTKVGFKLPTDNAETTTEHEDAVDENETGKEGVQENKREEVGFKPQGMGGVKPEDPETKGITEGDKGINPGSQDGNRGTGKK